MKAFLAVEWETGMNLYTFDMEEYQFTTTEPVTADRLDVVLRGASPIGQRVSIRSRSNTRKGWNTLTRFAGLTIGGPGRMAVTSGRGSSATTVTSSSRWPSWMTTMRMA